MTFEEFKQEIKDDIEYYLAKLTPKEINSDEIADKHTLKLIALFFIKGVKLGFKKGLKAKINITTISDCPKEKWHDLQKNPDDLPPLKGKNISINILTDDGIIAYYSYSCRMWYDFNNDCVSSPKAWCEIPKFEGGVN